MNNNLSLTNQKSSHLSAAPAQWLFDRSVIEHENVNLTTPGLFVKKTFRQPDLTDIHSQLLGIDTKIGKCENVDTVSLNKAKELSAGLQTLYKKNTNIQQSENSGMFNNTRLEQPVEAISETANTRQDILLFDPQNPDYFIRDVPTRGGEWSRNNFRDNFSCPPADNRGGNAGA